jgi:hypothetical protein
VKRIEMITYTEKGTVINLEVTFTAISQRETYRSSIRKSLCIFCIGRFFTAIPRAIEQLSVPRSQTVVNRVQAFVVAARTEIVLRSSAVLWQFSTRIARKAVERATLGANPGPQKV